MDNEKKIGFCIRELNLCVKKLIDKYKTEDGNEDITMVQHWIIKYLAMNNDHPVYQRELEKGVKIGKSTLTEVLHLMEKNGYVRRVVSDADARYKQIVLTDKAMKIHSDISNHINQMEEKLRKNLSVEDIDNFLRITQKMIENITAETKGDNHD